MLTAIALNQGFLCTTGLDPQFGPSLAHVSVFACSGSFIREPKNSCKEAAAAAALVSLWLACLAAALVNLSVWCRRGNAELCLPRDVCGMLISMAEPHHCLSLPLHLTRHMFESVWILHVGRHLNLLKGLFVYSPTFLSPGLHVPSTSVQP